MHLQPASKFMVIKKIFPITEMLADTSISLPVHEFIRKKHLNKIINVIKNKLDDK